MAGFMGPVLSTTLTRRRAGVQGDNTYGQLGDATWTRRQTPIYAAGAGPWSSMQAAHSYTCGINASDSSVWCFGASPGGGTPGGSPSYAPAYNAPTPVWLLGGMVTAARLATGGSHACAIATPQAAPR